MVKDIRQPPTSTKLHGSIWLSNEKAAFAEEQVKLLAAIEQYGSISAAAKQVKISYKTAWDRIEAINNMSEKPLLVRTAGGSKGGGSILTDYGRRIINGFHLMQEEHKIFMERMSVHVSALDDIANFMRTNTLKTSARNQFRGIITSVTSGAVNAEIDLEISDSQSLVAIVTEDSWQHMGLAVGNSITALIKASSVIISKDINMMSSARNKLCGHILRTVKGAVNSDVVIDLGEGKSISAIITNDSAKELGLQEGDPACAIFKASSVILMAD